MPSIKVIIRKHQAYAEPVVGGQKGYRGRCHDCNWEGPLYERGYPEPHLKQDARADARRHEMTATVVREVPHQILGQGKLTIDYELR